ncbi:hypothetical protein OPV22_006244 [Ensete ventricosum]|uniref:RING-type domain-containing protein n=1 Tax=Ensete ventricosum TaxID=4639 RepID=A0AAV8RPA4_ENSVE|nr:hypothetical protein OPV22_006244 [Ensete ventricosum]
MSSPVQNSSSSTTTTLSPPPLSPPPPPNNWGPYSGAKDFDANMASILVVLVCATAISFALNAAFRLLRRRYLPRSAAHLDKPGTATAAPQQLLPGPVVFSVGATAVAGAPECAICLAELAEGDRVHVLPACNHGFHAQCVETWFVGRSSCPTCRTECRPPLPLPPPPLPEP